MTTSTQDRHERLAAIRRMLNQHGVVASGVLAKDIAAADAFLERIADTGVKLEDMDEKIFEWLIGTPDKPGAIQRTFEARQERLREFEPIADATLDRNRDAALDKANTHKPPVFANQPGAWNKSA